MSASFEDIRVDRVKAALTDPASLAAFESLMEQLDGAMEVAVGAEGAAFEMRGELAAAERERALLSAMPQVTCVAYDSDGNRYKTVQLMSGDADAVRAVVELREDRDRLRRALVQHHGMHNLSDAAIRESIGRTCQICARAALSAGSGGRETSYTCPCGYSGPEECNGCPGGCKRRPAGVTGWDHIDRAGGRETTP